ncbi:uncharacterized protein C8A04DRAFT_30474 [Dichotomopilus funicola]|uniref:Uncharacterized protein n=1 Tax=Dichotomopilus funicola TaxID=1934379 RepID=A0AAN6ZKL6_9PEZI|nr:hypothetical protein C8A04DRAFT_30474 [Dichotomopilus funicola]
MSNQRSIPDPPPGYHLRDYLHYGKVRMLLHNDELDGPPLGDYVMPQQLAPMRRFVEGNFLPVTDREGQRREQRCAELCDKFLASATVDNETNAENSGMGTKGRAAAAKAGAAQNQNQNHASNPQNYPEHNNNNNLPTTLHIPTAEFYEFTNLLHELATPPPRPPSPPKPFTTVSNLSARETLVTKRTTALDEREADLHHRERIIRFWESEKRKRDAWFKQRESDMQKREEKMKKMEEECKKREATAALLYNDEAMARHLEGVWRMGYRKAREEMGLPGGDGASAGGDGNIGAGGG